MNFHHRVSMVNVSGNSSWLAQRSRRSKCAVPNDIAKEKVSQLLNLHRRERESALQLTFAFACQSLHSRLKT